jgi:glycosyltransferase involved in cell wall biosynthesis
MKLVGKVVRDNIREYYEMADIFVLPSLSENLPNVLVECLAMGIPAIASDIAGIPELIKHNLTGLLVKPNDVKELAEAIKLLIENRTLAESLAQNGRRLVCQDFNEEKCLDQLVSLYSLNRVITN